MFEHRHQPLLSRKAFARRMGRSVAALVAILSASLTLGTLGYAWLGGLAAVDAFLNASMILTGMGPVSPMTTTAGKLFASFYALFSGVVFLAGVGLILGPVLHRFLHRFHLDPDQPARRSKP